MLELVDITLPVEQQGESVVERWLRQVGERVRQHEPLLEVNTDKAVVEIASPASGVLQEILKQPNDPVQPGDVLGRIAVSDGIAPAQPVKPAAPVMVATEPSPPARVEELSPAVRQLVRQHQLDVTKIPGTGRGGRITYEDVQQFLQRQPAPPGELLRPGRRVPHSSMRQRIAQHMVESVLKTAPHVTAVFDADLSAVVAHRTRHRDDFERRGVKLTYTPYFVAAAVKALQAVPEVNSRWHEDALEIFDDCNIGVATAVPGGLLVPVLHRAQELDLFAIANRLQALTERARAGKLQPSDMQGGTFTITNHGVSGSLIATPIIVQPQSAILGVGKLEKRPVVVEVGGQDALQIKPMAYVTLTIDHRALDGFNANTFLGHFVEALQGEWPA
jgi:2-oxoglutarate dehydrogenase E2 component (dihydrolipoamide succinyltransferase)